MFYGCLQCCTYFFSNLCCFVCCCKYFSFYSHLLHIGKNIVIKQDMLLMLSALKAGHASTHTHIYMHILIQQHSHTLTHPHLHLQFHIFLCFHLHVSYSFVLIPCCCCCYCCGALKCIEYLNMRFGAHMWRSCQRVQQITK